MPQDYTIHARPCGTLAEVPDGSVHVAVTSPPFNMSYKPQKGKNFNLDGYGSTCLDRLPEPEYQRGQIEILNAHGRVLHPDGSLFYNHRDRRSKGTIISPLEWIASVTELAVYDIIIWDRGSSHNVAPGFLPPTIQYIFWFCKPGKKPRFNKACRKWGLVWRISPHAETGKIPHPAPFPLVIPLRCILMSDPAPGDTVLDCYLGSGTTGVAAQLCSMRFIGYEINTDYIKLARRRLERAKGVR